MDWSVVGIVISLVMIVVLALRGWHIIVIAPLAAVVVALFSSMDVMSTLTGPYMKGFVNYASRFYLLFLAGSIFGKFMEDSGAARSIAESILKLIGRSNPLVAVGVAGLIGGVLTYGGVSLFVVVFALIPIARPMWRELDMPWHLFAVSFAFGIGTVTMTMLPGSPQILNIMPTKYMDSTAMAAPLLGIVASIVALVFTFFYARYQIKRYQKRGEHYVASSGIGMVVGETESVNMEKLPNVWLSLLPMVVVIVMLNAVKLDAVWALLIGTAVCVTFFWKQYGNILSTLNKGAVNTVIPIINTCADVGYGMAVAATTGFTVISAWLLTLPMHPIVSLSVATNIMAGITGSASGGLGIVLETIVGPYLAMGLNPELIHRIATISAGCFDAMPHNGVIITFLAVAGLTHMNAYKHIFFIAVLAPLMSLIVVIPLGIFLY
jgi:H+/gluconate symporter-like permease